MLRQDIDEEDLRSEILILRKRIAGVCSENQILKVKIRKLQYDMSRQDKQLDNYLYSKRPLGFLKNGQEKGVSAWINLKLKNDKLEQVLLEKDLTIKRLLNTLQTAKLYNANSLNKKFASKGVECALITDNKVDFLQKGKTNTKVEVHLPKFDNDEIDEYKENLDSPDEVIVDRRKVNSVESNFLLDINFGLKQKSKPTSFSEARYKSQCASYHIETKETKSDDILEENRMITQFLPLRCEVFENNYTEQHQYQLKKSSMHEEENLTPTFRKILHTIEELMNDGKLSACLHKKESVDRCIQFPAEDGPRHCEVTNFVVTSQNVNEEDHNTEQSLGDTKNEVSSVFFETIETQVESGLVASTVEAGVMIDTQPVVDNLVDNEKPHEEIKQLHVYLMDMISQVDSLKDTIFQMKADQEKTDVDLKSKNESIARLAKEIEQLRELKGKSANECEKRTKSTTTKSVQEEVQPIRSCKTIQKATEDNIKKIAGKMKHLKESKSKSSILSQPQEKKTSRSSSKNRKPEKKKTAVKSNLSKSDKKMLKTPQFKNAFGIGNGDVIEIPFFRCGLAQTSCDSEKLMKNEFDELD